MAWDGVKREGGGIEGDSIGADLLRINSLCFICEGIADALNNDVHIFSSVCGWINLSWRFVNHNIHISNV